MYHFRERKENKSDVVESRCKAGRELQDGRVRKEVTSELRPEG